MVKYVQVDTTNFLYTGKFYSYSDCAWVIDSVVYTWVGMPALTFAVLDD